nr:MAG TPA: TRAF PROTEIN, TRAO PROTEIN, TRAN ADHESION, BACTERIAL SECRETION.5A [Caudoviricetes sp.]
MALMWRNYLKITQNPKLGFAIQTRLTAGFVVSLPLCYDCRIIYRGDRDMKKIILAIIGIALVGCSQPKPAEPDMMSTIDFSKADYGQPPSDYKLQIKSWLEQNLKDPDSAKVSEPTPLRKEVAIDNRQPIFGYTTCMGVNSKNSYGGYTGTQGYWFFFHNGKIVRAQNMETFPGRMIFRNHYVKCD